MKKRKLAVLTPPRKHLRKYPYTQIPVEELRHPSEGLQNIEQRNKKR